MAQVEIRAEVTYSCPGDPTIRTKPMLVAPKEAEILVTEASTNIDHCPCGSESHQPEIGVVYLKRNVT